MTAKNNEQKFSIRQMQIDDLAPVFHLGEKLFTLKEYPTLYRTWDEHEVIDYYKGNPEYCLVAECNGEFVGFLLGSIIDKRNSYRKYGYLVWFGVDEKFQGTGASTMLYEKYREIMLGEDVRMLMVDTSADNERALAFFTGRGFSSPKDHVYLTLNLTEEKKSQ